MKRFIVRVIFFLAFFTSFILMLALFFSSKVTSRDFHNYETESNLLVLEENESYDLAIVGISHARVFARDKNHLRLEKMLQKKILNLGQGSAKCGVSNLMFFLKYAYKLNISIDTIAYIITPPLLFNNSLNKAANTFEFEPFRLDFFWSYLNFDAQNKYERLFYYIKSKFQTDWINLKPKTRAGNFAKLNRLDINVVNKGFQSAYPDGLDEQIFKKNCRIVEKNILLAKQNKSELVFVVYPALFGKWKGHDKLIEFCNEMQIKYNVQYYDFSETILKPEFYYDHHHLNTPGVEYFVGKYLKKIFSN